MRDLQRGLPWLTLAASQARIAQQVLAHSTHMLHETGVRACFVINDILV